MSDDECNCAALTAPRHLHRGDCPAYRELEPWQSSLLTAARRARATGHAVLLHAPSTQQGATENQLLAAVVKALHEGKDVVIVRTKPGLMR